MYLRIVRTFFRFLEGYVLTEFYCTIYIQARFACLRCAAGGHFVSAGGALWAPGVAMINYKRENISKYVSTTVIIKIAQKSPNLSIFKILMRNDEVQKIPICQKLAFYDRQFLQSIRYRYIYMLWAI